MLRIAVCDDQSTELKLLAKLLEQYETLRQCGPLELELYSSPSALLRRIGDRVDFDFFILDMMMPEYSGIDVGKAIRAGERDGAIIYITASPDFALDAISVHPEQYLLKPLDPEALYRALDDARRRMDSKASAYLTVKTHSGVERLPCDQIVCVEHAERIMRVYTQSGEMLESVCLRAPFEKLTEPVLQLQEFVRTHKSYLVNLHHIRSLQQGELRTDTNLLVPISRRNAAEVRRKYLTLAECGRETVFRD